MAHVNLNAWSVVQHERFPWRVWAVTALKAPGNDGLPSEEEHRELIDAERELLLRIPDDDNAIFLGHLHHQFHHVTVLHCRAADVLAKPPAASIRGRRYTWSIYTESDPSYNFVRAKFLPSNAEFRRHRNAEILALLRKEGDNPAAPRVINFYGMFLRLHDAELAASQLTKKGFRPTAPSEMPKQAYPWSMMFQRVSPTDTDSIEKVTETCESVCNECNGYYDGWECEIIR
ncbi:DUF695 domain-containing protein [Candidatus Sumerlaeota bacterium]|nr:DUF695 domain-containing protein [Candidatus Sumerlaeota bacterium]